MIYVIYYTDEENTYIYGATTSAEKAELMRRRASGITTEAKIMMCKDGELIEKAKAHYLENPTLYWVISFNFELNDISYCKQYWGEKGVQIDYHCSLSYINVENIIAPTYEIACEKARDIAREVRKNYVDELVKRIKKYEDN